MTETNKRVTVDFDSQSYYLDGKYWESWDNYGEEMADKINELLNKLAEENEQLKFENNELKCALALDEVEYIIADGKKIDIPPYYEFEQRYDSVMHRREYDGYD